MSRRQSMCALMLCLAITVGFSGVAYARRPAVEVSIVNSRVNVREAVELSYGSMAVGHATLYLQTQVGTAHVWKTIEPLSGTRGTVTVTGRLMGIYQYRLVAKYHGRTVAASPVQRLYSYGPVSLSTVCRALGAPCSPGLLTIGDTILEYEEGPNAPGATYPIFEEGIKAGDTTCRSGAFQFALYRFGQGGRAFMKLIQARSEPQESSTAAATEIGTLDATFDGGAWNLTVSSTTGSNVVMRGTLSCYTPTGV